MDNKNPPTKSEKLSPRELLERYRFTGKLTPSLRSAVCEAVRHGTPARTALKAFGLDDQTIRNWEKWAESKEKGSKYGEFSSELGRAWNEWVHYVASLGEKHIEKDARVWSTTIQALLPDEYGKKDETTVTFELGPVLAEIARQVSSGALDAQWKELPSGNPDPSLPGSQEQKV